MYEQIWFMLKDGMLGTSINNKLLKCAKTQNLSKNVSKNHQIYQFLVRFRHFLVRSNTFFTALKKMCLKKCSKLHHFARKIVKACYFPLILVKKLFFITSALKP
jgi:hypothetical protein